MTDARDFELLDDYLANRLSEQDRSAFEQKLQADPVLQHEFTLQNRLVKGIKDARVAELKSMFNNIAVPANGPEKILGTKIVIGTVVSILVATTAFWYMHKDEIKITRPDAIPQEQNTTKGPVTPTPKAGSEANNTKETTIIETDKNQTSAGTEQRKPSQARKPDPLKAPQGKKSQGSSEAKAPVLDVFDPSTEEKESGVNIKNENPAGFIPIKASSLVVETDTESRRFTFHYQFNNEKVFLYGPFHKNLYEILEFFSDDKRTVFLFYKQNFYLLEERSGEVRPLTAISDPAVIKKLQEYRSTK